MDGSARRSDGDDGRWGWLDRDCIAYHAQVRPQALACVALADGTRLSFADLDAQVGRCARWMAATLPPGARVALLARNSLQTVVLFYACARAGMVFVPLNWRLGPPELRPLLADSAPSLLIDDPEFETCADAALAGMPDVLRRSSTMQDWDAAPTGAPTPLRPDGPWVLLYTSGTTGRPKGVIVTRRSAFFAAWNFIQVGGYHARSKALADAPLFHTVGLFAITHAALTAGAGVLIAERFVPGETLRRLSDPALGVTHYFCVPQMALALRADPAYPAADLSRLTGFFTGGAPMPSSLAEALLRDGVPLSNGYGLSEAGTVMHTPPGGGGLPSGSCGFPAPAVEVRLVGLDGEPVPAGTVGEIWLRGPAVTPGYWRQPEATAAAFQDGWLRTGDAARLDPDGSYSVVDRWKDMYISGGENVYPAEVEAALMELEGVADAAVVGAPDPRWGEAGWAFVVAAPGSGLDAEAVAAFCRARLAGFKRPAAVRFLDAVPRTASGKARKDALRALVGPPEAQPPTG